MRLGTDKGILTINGSSVVPSDEVLSKEYGHVFRLRFDPVNACNAKCVFCGTAFPKKVPRLDLVEFRRALKFLLRNKLRYLDFGCGYEPLIAPNFEEVSRLLLEEKVADRVDLLTLVTNGHFLHRKNLDILVEAGLGMIHLSLHSHIPDIYRATMGAGDLKQTEKNILAIKEKYPHVMIQLVNVVTPINKVDLPGFVRWGMDRLKADKIVLRRAYWDEKPMPDSPMIKYVEAIEGSPDLTDEEWRNLAAEVYELKDCYDMVITHGRVRAGAQKIPIVSIRPKGQGHKDSVILRKIRTVYYFLSRLLT